MLTGIYTHGALDQLRSLGFHVLHFPTESVVAAFASQGIDIDFDQRTPERIFRQATDRIKNASADTMSSIRKHLIAANRKAIKVFFAALTKRLARHVTRVASVITLYGRTNEFATINDAVKFLDQHRIHAGSGDFRKYEIRIEFSNGDKVEASLEAKAKVKEFLAFVARQ